MDIKTEARFSFSGGTHPPEKKYLTRERRIQPGPVCTEVAVALSQHIGAVCEPLVKKGDSVSRGQKIGASAAFVSAPVHSPVNGKVKEITLRSHPVLGRSPAVVITAEPAENPATEPASGRFEQGFEGKRFSAEAIRQAVAEAGVVGMGGAGFPTAVKLAAAPVSNEQVLIINGCECEPYITCDYRVMLEWTQQVLAGVRFAGRACGASRVYIAIEDNKPAAIDAMVSAVQRSWNGGEIQVVRLKTRYPQGGERQLIKSILNKQVPTGGIPPKIGVVVVNIATAAAIAEAVVPGPGSALTHRVVTVTGEGIARPGNYYVAVGTPVGELIDFCGGLTEDAVRVVLGGPMTGAAIGDLSMPVMKTTGAVTVLTAEQTGRSGFAGRQSACIRCGRCLEVCPERLNPTKIAQAVEKKRLDVAQNYYISACIECGCCSFVCPANIEVAGLIKTGKVLLARQQKNART